MAITFEKLMAGDYRALAYGDPAFSMKVTLVKVNTLTNIPRVVFSWVVRHQLSLTADQAAMLEEGVLSRSPEGIYTYAAEIKKGAVEVTHVTLMNFRRYGWCTASGYNAEYGYANGIVYANKIDGGINAANGAQVVRDTFIATVAGMPRTSRIPHQLLYCNYARRAFEFLLEDALNNISAHALPGVHGTSDTDWDIRMGITGEVLGDNT